MIKKLIEKLESKLSYELLGALMDVCISEGRHDVNKGCVRRLASTIRVSLLPPVLMVVLGILLSRLGKAEKHLIDPPKISNVRHLRKYTMVDDESRKQGSLLFKEANA